MRTLLPCALIVIASLSCDSPTAPASDPNALTFGYPATGSLAPNDSQVFHLAVSTGAGFAVYLQSDGDALQLTLEDSAGHRLQSVWSPPAATGPTGDRGAYSYGVMVPNVAVPARYTLVVAAPAPRSTGGHFTLRPIRIDAAPEHGSATIPLDSVISFERLDYAADRDEFRVTVPVATDVELYVVLDSVADCLQAAIMSAKDSTSELFGAACTLDRSADIERGALGRVTLSAGTHLVRFSGGQTTAAGVPYTFLLRTVHHAPEHAAAQLTLGDTISEAIDYVGDIDEFTLAGTPGAEYEVFVAADGADPHRALVVLPDLAPTTDTALAVAAPGTPLLDVPTGRFTMPATGRTTVRVTDRSDRNGLYRGPYRLLAVAIDRRPEGRSDTITPSTDVVSSALEIYGDVDEYRFTLDAPQRLALRCAPTAVGTGCVSLSAAVYADTDPTRPVELRVDRPLPAGAYRVRVESRAGQLAAGSQPHGMYRGAYQLVLASADTTPEGLPAAIAVGAPITKPSAWPFDVDSYILDIATADTVLFHVSQDSGGVIPALTVVNQATGKPLMPLDTTSGLAPQLTALPAGRYAVTVTSTWSAWAPGARSTYHLALERVSFAPESRSADVAVGDTVHERSDFDGDYDDFVLHAPPGEFVSGEVRPITGPPYTDHITFLTMIDPATGDSVGSTWSWFDPRLTLPTAMPASGTLRLRLFTSTFVPYAFTVHLANRAPETHPAAIVFADTVAEGFESAWDVDEFTFDAAPGQIVDLVGLDYSPGEVFLELVDPSTGARLTRLVFGGFRYRDDGVTRYPSPPNEINGIALPHAGRYLVRLMATVGAYGTPPYRFLVRARTP